MNTFSTNLAKYRRGERSLANFRRDIPFPFGTIGIHGLFYKKEKKAFCFRLFSIPFKTYLGKDYTDKRSLLEQVVAGNIKLCTSKIQLNKGKIYWLAVFEVAKEKHNLKPEVIAEASLSLEHPIIVKSRKATLSIGSREEFLYRRLAIQAALKRAQNATAYCRSGKGRKRKTKAVERFQEKEKTMLVTACMYTAESLLIFVLNMKPGHLFY